MKKFFIVLCILTVICLGAYAFCFEKIVQYDHPLTRKLFLSTVPPEQEENCTDLIKRCEEVYRFCR